VLNRQCLDRCIPDKATLAQETAAWAAKRNNNGSTANWRFTTDDARIKLKRLYPSIDLSITHKLGLFVNKIPSSGNVLQT
jgi:hypothetical protein